MWLMYHQGVLARGIWAGLTYSRFMAGRMSVADVQIFLHRAGLVGCECGAEYTAIYDR